MYNVTQLWNTSNYGDYLVVLNSESGGFLGVTLLVVIAVILLIVFQKEGMGVAASASGFITSIAAILMFAIGFIPPTYLIYPVLLFASGVIGKKIGG